jgi:hypothetical protein
MHWFIWLCLWLSWKNPAECFWHLMFCFRLAASYFALFVVCAVSLPLPVPWLLKWLMNWFNSNRWIVVWLLYGVTWRSGFLFWGPTSDDAWDVMTVRPGHNLLDLRSFENWFWCHFKGCLDCWILIPLNYCVWWWSWPIFLLIVNFHSFLANVLEICVRESQSLTVLA